MNDASSGFGPLRAAIYRRISEKDEGFDKVENQADILNEFCAANGYEIVADYCDDGVSAWRDDVVRPDWQRLLADIPSGEFDVIVATFENRLSRQTIEKVELLAVCKKAGVRWHTKHDGLVDPASDDQHIMAILRGWQAQSEVGGRIKAQRQRFDAQRAAGLPLWGIRPFGFEANRIDHFHGSPERPYDEAAEVLWAYEQVIEQKTLYSIMKSWKDRGIKTTTGKEWSYATLQQLLRRESNAGLWKDKEMAWAPLVPVETFNAVQAMLKRPERAKSRVREPRWLMAGIAKCGSCGSVMRSARGADRQGGYPVYRCSATMSTGKSKPVFDTDGRPLRHASIRCEELDREVAAAVGSAFLFGVADELPSNVADVSDMRKAQTELVSVRDSLARVTRSITNPDFDPAVLAEEATTLRKREAVLQTLIGDITTRSAHAAMLMESQREVLQTGGQRLLFKDAQRAKVEVEERFTSLPLHQRRVLVRGLLDVTVFPGRRPSRVQVWHTQITSLNMSAEPRLVLGSFMGESHEGAIS